MVGLLCGALISRQACRSLAFLAPSSAAASRVIVTKTSSTTSSCCKLNYYQPSHSVRLFSTSEPRSDFAVVGGDKDDNNTNINVVESDAKEEGGKKSSGGSNDDEDWFADYDARKERPDTTNRSGSGSSARGARHSSRDSRNNYSHNDSSSRNRREVFRGTRVFVQDLPLNASSEDLKDHFRVAGEVVFASVSVDGQTGNSKGSGIVQFESNDGAKKAIKIMRQHPLDGATLYVREDYQEAKNKRNADSTNHRSGGGSSSDRGARHSGRDNSNNSRSFRDDFRGRRVFVQGLPLDATWQNLKDHFRVAGAVAYASVSVDRQTGISKGSGIVQYETLEEAKNAIEIMRDHPLDGAHLYVREDYQEKKDDRSLKTGDDKRGVGRGDKSSKNDIWKCADEDVAAGLSETEREEILNLVKARDDARRKREYTASDTMREELKRKFNVHLDDKLKLWWWKSIDRPSVPKTLVTDASGSVLEPWQQIPTTPENDTCVDPDLVNGLLKQRDIARRAKDFYSADSLLEQARTAPFGDLDCLSIHDESRTWRVWTEAPPSWRQVATTPDNNVCVDPDLVNGLLEQRDTARREKDYYTADSLLEQARTAPDGDLNYLRIHDKSRTWQIWKEEAPQEGESITTTTGATEENQ
jgi:RNA recognition motif-containing protein